MSRLVTLLGYGLVVLAAAAQEVAARRWGRGATLGGAATAILRYWPVRVLLLAGWWWLGWHLFVRVHWR